MSGIRGCLLGLLVFSLAFAAVFSIVIVGVTLIGAHLDIPLNLLQPWVSLYLWLY